MRRRQSGDGRYPFVGPGRRWATVAEWRKWVDAQRERRRRLLRLVTDDDREGGR